MKIRCTKLVSHQMHKAQASDCKPIHCVCALCAFGVKLALLQLTIKTLTGHSDYS